MSYQQGSQWLLRSTFPTFLLHLNEFPLDYSGMWDRVTSAVGYVVPLANQMTAKGSNASTSLFSGLQMSSGILFFWNRNALPGNQLLPKADVNFQVFQFFVLATNLNTQPDAERVSYDC